MKTYVEINPNHLLHNLAQFRNFTGKPIMLVVKGNAYGHGLREVVSITRHLPEITYYAVDSVTEALEVRALAPDKPILVIGWADPHELKEALAADCHLVAHSLDYAAKTAELAKQLHKTARLHIKVETGTGRLGMPPEHAVTLIKHSLENSSPKKPGPIQITGIYSHFANIEDTSDHSYARHQLDIFNTLINQLNQTETLKHQLQHTLKHFSCSASTLLLPETHFDMVRVGVSAYGFWPSKQTYISHIQAFNPPVQLKPVLSWHTHVAQVKTLEKGQPIGYGLTYRVFDRTRIIVLPVGYYDGYDRKLSNAATVVVNGSRAPVRGRVCMNMCMAEVNHVPTVKEGDRVTLIGEQNGETVTADQLAELAGTINYEIVSRINPIIPRIITKTEPKRDS